MVRPVGYGDHVRRTVIVCSVVLGLAALLWTSGTTTAARARPVAASAIRVQTTFCARLFSCFTTTAPPTSPPTQPTVTVSPCINLGATRVCPTTPTTAPAASTKPGTPTTAGGGAVIVLDGGSPITPPPIVTTPPTPDEARIQVSGFDFGPVQVGLKSAAAEVVVTNVGSIPVRFLGATTEGPFAVIGSTCGNGGVLNVRATCTVAVQYSSTGAGLQTGSVIVTVLAPAGNIVQPGPLQGTSTRSQIAIDPAGVDFGSITPLDAVAPASLLVRNTGSGPARITGLGFAGASKDFAIQPGGCLGVTLAPGATCPFTITITITAKAKTGGLRSALVVATGASGEIARATVNVRLLRTGLGVAPTPLDLGAALIGAPAVAKNATVRNIGEVPVAIAAVALAGPQAAEFSITVNGCAGVTLKPKATCPVTIGGKPGQAGLRSVSLTVTGGRKESAKSLLRMRGMAPTTTAPTTIPVVTTVPPVTKPATTVVATSPPTAPPTSPPTAPPTTLPPAVFTPSLVMRPAVGRPGGVTEAIGTGFPPNATVHLSWEGDHVVRAVSADGSGRFSLSVVLMPGERIGGRYMATVDEASAYPGVRAPFLVQLPTFRPPGDSGQAGSLVGRG